MLTGAELAIALAAVLIGAVAAGALLHWLWLRLGGMGTSAAARVERLSAQLHEAEMAQEAAELACREAEAELAAGERRAEENMAALKARLEAAREERETALERELAEARSDLETLRDGLRHARQRLRQLETDLGLSDEPQ